jgi:hypothetical protein
VAKCVCNTVQLLQRPEVSKLRQLIQHLINNNMKEKLLLFETKQIELDKASDV